MLTACVVVALGLLAFQTALVAGFVRATRRAPSPGSVAARSRSVVVVCARGADPSLPACLAELEAQVGEQDSLILVTDDRRDPAVEVGVQRQRAHPDSRLELLVVPPTAAGCSLKCQSLATAAATRAAAGDWLVLVDADAVPPPDALLRLYEAARDHAADAAFGHRWFEPPSGDLGGRLRFIWNAAAIVQMHWYRIPWGGCLAIRAPLVRELDLPALWRTALFEDVLLTETLAAHGRRIASAATVFSVSRETCSVATSWRWMVRQLLDVRLYHRRWSWVVAHAVLVAGLPLALLACGIERASQAAWSAAAWAVGWAVFVQLINAGQLLWIARAVAAAIDATKNLGHPAGPTASRPHGPGFFLQNLAWVGVVQWLHLAAVLRAATVRRIAWRGIDYAVRGPWAIRRETYHPLVSESRS